MISLIVAVGENNEIGAKNKLLWHLPADFKWFKQNTLGKPVIMGRKTHESIGRALPDRANIVITRQQNYAPLGDNITLENSLTSALKNVDNSLENMILGGAEIYQQALPHVQKIYLTRVHQTYPEADTFFPKLDKNDWQETFTEAHPADGEKPAFTFHILTRKKEA